jgi:hypothetical protein
MHHETLIQTLSEELQRRHGCHTVILYGSRARGDESSESDYDLAGFRIGNNIVRDARILDDAFVDMFIYPESYLSQPPPELLKLRDGIVLTEKDGAGRRLLANLVKLFVAGPPRLPADEVQARRIWAQKMLERAKRGDTEGDYRRLWLLTALLEDYFSIRGLWYLGPKTSLQWLRCHDVMTFDALAVALKPGASIDSIAMAVAAVVSDGTLQGEPSKE